jgi:hypothetical protein
LGSSSEAYDNAKFRDGRCNLHLKAVSVSDIGDWMCLADNEVEKVVEVAAASQPRYVRLVSILFIFI